MRIWLMLTEYPPMHGGGISTYAGFATRMWQHGGHEVTVFLADDTVNSAITQVVENVRVIRFPKHLDPLYDVLGYVARLSYAYALTLARWIADEGPPDIIESQDYLGLAYFVLQRKYTLDPVFREIPVVVVGHSPKFLLAPLDHVPLYQLPDYWTGEMEKFCYRAADLVVAPSQAFRQAVMEALPGIDPVVIPNPFVAAPLLGPDPTMRHGILYIGRIQALKGVALLTESMDRLWSRGVNAPLDLVGGDIYFSPKGMGLTEVLTRRYPHHVRDGRLKFHGSVPPNTLHNWLAQARLVVLPSLFESFSYALLEAMAAGTVVVSANTGIAPEIIDEGRNGFLFTPNDPVDLARAISHALDMATDRLDTIGNHARASLADWDEAAQLALREERYHPLIGHSETKHQFPWIRPVPPLKPQAPRDRELSVVVPYFNMGAYVAETLESLLNVKDVDLEIIIVDDGSTDPHSISVLEQWHDRHPQLQIIRTENQGLALTRNVGAEAARGSYLAFLDADDWVDPEYYRQALTILRHFDNVSFVAGWTQYFEASTNLWPTWNTEPPYIFYHNTVNSSALIYRRQDFVDHGLNDASMLYGMEDWESVVRMVASGHRGVAIPTPLFHYRIRPDSMSRAFNRENQLYLYGRITELNPAIYAQYGGEIAQLFNANGPQARVDNPTWQVFHETQGDPEQGPMAPRRPLWYRAARRVKRHVKGFFN